MPYRCPLCYHHQGSIIYSQPPYQVIQCHHCGLGTLTPWPTTQELDRLYSGDYFEYAGEVDYYHDAVKKCDLIEKIIPTTAAVLDYGCGTGHVLKILKQKGYSVQGFDLSPQIAAKARTFASVPVASGQSKMKTYPPQTFDVITAFDVIEHVKNFPELLTYFATWLKPGGKLLLTTPNLDSWDHRLCGSHWYGFTKIPQHLVYFNRHSLDLVCRRAGLNITHLQTWGFSRSLEYIGRQLRLPQPLVKRLHHSKLHLYLPMIDLMAVVSKPV